MSTKRLRPCSKLDKFMTEHQLRPSRLAREAGITRQHLLRIRKGDVDLGIFTAMRIRDACGRLLLRRVGIAEVFEVD